MDDRVAALLDKQEIHETLLRYFRGIDRCDAELIASAFHPDAVAEHGPNQFTGADIGERTSTGMREHYRASMHFTGNQMIELHGDVANVETYNFNYHLQDREGREELFVRAIRYVDRLERRDGEWKIARRRVICEWDSIEPITERSAFPPYAPTHRSRDDISYAGSEVS
jgi:ketosteroid isomerase-like protein